MLNNRRLLYDYSHDSLSKENMERFLYSNENKNFIFKVNNIIHRARGLYVVGGQRGVGKSSLIKKAIIECSDKSILIVDLSVQAIKENFYYELLIAIGKSPALSENENKELERLKKLYISNVIDSEKTGSKSINSSASQKEKGFYASLKGIVELVKKKNETKEELVYSETDITFLYEKSNDEKDKEFLYFLDQLTNKRKIVIVIDELDKLEAKKIGDFIHKYKELLISIKVLVFLVCNKYDALFLEECYYEYVNEFIYCNNLDINDFIVRVYGMGIADDMPMAIRLYYQTTGNSREIIKFYYSEEIEEKGFEKGMLMFYFLNSDFYNRFDEKYRDILVSFFKMVIEYLYMFESIEDNELNEIKKTFLKKSNGVLKIDILIEKCVQYIKTNIVVKKIYLRHDKFHFEDFDDAFVNTLNKIFNSEICLFNKEGRFNVSNYKENHIEFENRVHNYNKLSGNEHSINFYKQWEKFYLYKYKELVFINKIIKEAPKRIKFHDDNNSVENAIYRIESCMKNIVGVILFEPYNRNGDNNDRPLYNGYIITYNGFEVVWLAYLGYPGLTSHKKGELNKLITCLKTNKIPSISITNTPEIQVIWDKYFIIKDNPQYLNKLIKESGKIDEWFDKLCVCHNRSENLYENEIEIIVM